MKHGIIDVTTGEPVLKARGGILNMVTDAVTTMGSIQKVPVGYPALIQRVGFALAGNALAVHSTTGQIGVGVLGTNAYLKR